MGGGGTMRSAAKLVGLGVFNSGLRGSQVETPFSTAVRRGTRPASAVISSSDDVQLLPQQDGTLDVSVQRPYWGLDDWEFAGSDEELMMSSGKTMPRVVFGGVPTLQETEEATSELRHVLDEAYLSPKSPNSEYSEAKGYVVSESVVAAPVPKHVIQALRFLNESPAAQSVVASIACDPKVWNAVSENEAVVGFLQSHQTSVPFPDKVMNWFKDTFEKVKVTVAEMRSNLSDYFQNHFSSAYEHVFPDRDDKEFHVDKTVGASLMGLAVMVIMVVVLKRI